MTMTTELVELADRLSAEIRRVDGNHTLGAGSLAEALVPFIADELALRAGGPVMIGKMVEVEFSRQQITFKMQGDYHCTAGTYEIRRLAAAPEPVGVGVE